MDRRAFLRRAIGGTAVVAASVQSGWSLKTLRDVLGRLFRWQEVKPRGLFDIVDPEVVPQWSSLRADDRSALRGGFDFISSVVVRSRSSFLAYG